MAADPELEATRQRRMQELVAQQGGGNNQQNLEQQKAQEEAREMDERRQTRCQILSSQARERLIGVIKRKALIKDLAAVYHAECLTCCEELLELQRKWEETYIEAKASENIRKETMRRPKRMKKTR